MNKILAILGLIAIGTIFLFVCCACIVSSIEDEREKENEIKHK